MEWPGGSPVGYSMRPSPSVFEVQLVQPDQKTRVIQVSSEQHIWDAALAHGILLPALCHQGRCLTCAGRLLEGGEIDQTDSVSYFPEDRKAGFILLCTGKPRSSLRILTHQQEEMRKFRRLKGLPSPYS